METPPTPKELKRSQEREAIRAENAKDRFLFNYTTEERKATLDEDKDKTIISTEAFAIGGLLQTLCNKLDQLMHSRW